MTQVVLTRAEIELHEVAAGKRTIDAVQALSDEALGLAARGEYRREEALAHRLLARCAAFRDVKADVLGHLHAALAIQQDMGAMLESARTKLALANATISGGEGDDVPLQAYKLLMEARESFLAVGAAWDLNEARRVSSAWDTPARSHDAS
jgi:hypothetical protein